MLVDDNILVEPDFGLRPALSAAVHEEGARRILGPNAMNVVKLAEEGEMSTQQTAWGLLLDTGCGSVEMPEQRNRKGAHVLALPIYDPGNARIPVLDLQRLHGTRQSWVPVAPPLGDRAENHCPFLGQPDGRGSATPAAHGPPAEQA